MEQGANVLRNRTEAQPRKTIFLIDLLFFHIIAMNREVLQTTAAAAAAA